MLPPPRGGGPSGKIRTIILPSKAAVKLHTAGGNAWNPKKESDDPDAKMVKVGVGGGGVDDGIVGWWGWWDHDGGGVGRSVVVRVGRSVVRASVASVCPCAGVPMSVHMSVAVSVDMVLSMPAHNAAPPTPPRQRRPLQIALGNTFDV